MTKKKKVEYIPVAGGLFDVLVITCDCGNINIIGCGEQNFEQDLGSFENRSEIRDFLKSYKK